MIGHPGWTGKRRRREWVLGLPGTPAIMEACLIATLRRDQRRLPADNRRARMRAKRALRVRRTFSEDWPLIRIADSAMAATMVRGEQSRKG